MLTQTVGKYHVPSRIRAYGKARIEVARRAQTPQEWDALWKRPQFDFPFEWGQHWKQCIEYRVEDFAAEVGFYIDILGLPINAFNPDYAMFTSPKGDFFFSVVQAPEGEYATPPEAFRLQFMVEDIFKTASELERRGIAFEQPPAPVGEGSTVYIAYFRTPHGICVDLWGTAEAQASQPDQPEIMETSPTDAETTGELTNTECEPEEDLFGEASPGASLQTARPAEDLEHGADLFEEVPEEPAAPPRVEKARPLPAKPPAPEELEPEYVDVEETEEDYPTYQPIPLNRPVV